MNSVCLVGRIGNDPEMLKTSTGKNVVKINLAVRRNSQTTDWIRCVGYEGVAELLTKYAKKGDLLGVEGQLFTESFDDKDGKKLNFTKVFMTSITFVEKKQAGSEDKEHSGLILKKDNNNIYPKDISKEVSLDIDDENLPF